jgi:hypothetical protein
MSDLPGAIDERIAAYTPPLVPSFAELTARKVRRDRRRLSAGGAAIAVVLVATAAAWASGGSAVRSTTDALGRRASSVPSSGVKGDPVPVAVDGGSFTMQGDRSLSVVVVVATGCQPPGTAAAVAAESVDKVQLEMTVVAPDPSAAPPATCPLEPVTRAVEVLLSQPLGDRAVIDLVGHRTLRAHGSRIAPGIQAPSAVELARTDEFGIVTGLTHVRGTLQISVDRVDMLGGAEAVAAAKAAGRDPLIDYFLRNDNPAVRTYPVSPGAVVWGSIQTLPQREPWPQRTTLAVWSQFVAAHLGQVPMFHFQVDGGVVVGIEEQYQP